MINSFEALKLCCKQEGIPWQREVKMMTDGTGELESWACRQEIITMLVAACSPKNDVLIVTACWELQLCFPAFVAVQSYFEGGQPQVSFIAACHSLRARKIFFSESCCQEKDGMG